MEHEKEKNTACNQKIMAIDDAMYVLGGKWKIHIIGALCFGKLRYSDLLDNIKNISGKMLSRELKDMEMNLLIFRKVQNTRPITVEYELTEYGKTLIPVIDKLADWGLTHRETIRR